MKKTRRFLSFVLASFLFAQTLPAAAIELEIPETAAETTQVSAAASLSAASSGEMTADQVELYDTTSMERGQLVFFSGFNNSENPLANEIEDRSPIKGLTIMTNGFGGIETIGGHTAFRSKLGGVDGNSMFTGIGVKGNTSYWQYENGTQVTGAVYVMVDYYYDADSVDAENVRIWYGIPSGRVSSVGEEKDARTWLETKNSGQWSYVSGNSNASQGTGYVSNIRIGRRDNTGGVSEPATPIYFDNLRIYILPDNAFWLASNESGANREFKVIPDSGFTFPDEWDGKPVEAWIDCKDENTVLEPGTTYTTDLLVQKTFYPVFDESAQSVSAPAAYDETYGQLVWFDNFSDNTGFENMANLKKADYMLDTDKTDYNGYTAIKAYNNNKILSTSAFEVQKDGESWTYTNGKPLSGKATFFADLMAGGTAIGFLPAVYNQTLAGSRVEGDKTWYSFNKSAYCVLWSAGVTPTVDDWNTYYSAPITLKSDDEHFGFLARSINTSYARAMGVYIVPDNALWLVDTAGENREFVFANEDNETYTFPKEFKGAAVAAWTCGTDAYNAGTVCKIANVAGKTWKACASENVNVTFTDEISVRTSGPSGIRYRAALDAKTCANPNLTEIGFMATREAHFTNQFVTEDNFTLDNEKSQNKAFCTVVSISSDKMDNYLTPDPATQNSYFNAVVVGVPDANLKEKIYLRAYAVCGGVKYYSNVKAQSIYEAAKTVKDSYPDDAYIKNIIEVCEQD